MIGHFRPGEMWPVRQPEQRTEAPVLKSALKKAGPCAEEGKNESLALRFGPEVDMVGNESLALASGQKAGSGGKKDGNRPPPTWPSRRLVEFCCGPDSLLGQPGPCTRGCEVIRLTEKDDVTTPSGLARALEAVEYPGVFLWASMPCTGGSPWQHINRHRPGVAAKIDRHWELARRIWGAFALVAKKALENGGYVAIEWPASCAYWKWPQVRAFVEENGLCSNRIDGCQFNLRARNGLPIMKPWRIATNMPSLSEALCGKVCKGPTAHAQHQPCAGSETKRTEAYTPELVSYVHHAFLCEVLRAEGRPNVSGRAPGAEGQKAVPAFACVPCLLPRLEDTAPVLPSLVVASAPAVAASQLSCRSCSAQWECELGACLLSVRGESPSVPERPKSPEASLPLVHQAPPPGLPSLVTLACPVGGENTSSMSRDHTDEEFEFGGGHNHDFDEVEWWGLDRAPSDTDGAPEDEGGAPDGVGQGPNADYMEALAPLIAAAQAGGQNLGPLLPWPHLGLPEPVDQWDTSVGSEWSSHPCSGMEDSSSACSSPLLSDSFDDCVSVHTEWGSLASSRGEEMRLITDERDITFMVLRLVGGGGNNDGEPASDQSSLPPQDVPQDQAPQQPANRITPIRAELPRPPQQWAHGRNPLRRTVPEGQEKRAFIPDRATAHRLCTDVYLNTPYDKGAHEVLISPDQLQYETGDVYDSERV